MTTIAERERSLEYHYAHLALLAFIERAHHHKAVARQVAEALGMSAAEADLFTAALVERCAAIPDDSTLCAIAARELAERGFALSPAEIRQLAKAAQLRTTAGAPAPHSWFEFLADQIVSLFSGRSTSGFGEKAPATAPHSGLPALSLALLVGTSLLLASAAARAAVSEPWSSPADAAAYGKGKVSLIQAIAVAERSTGGRAIHADFQAQNGKPTYQVDSIAANKVTRITIGADSDKIIESDPLGAPSTLPAPEQSAIAATANAKVNLETAAAEGDAQGDWAIDAGLTDDGGQPAYRVDLIKDGKLKTATVDPMSGKITDAGAGAGAK